MNQSQEEEYPISISLVSILKPNKYIILQTIVDMQLKVNNSIRGRRNIDKHFGFSVSEMEAMTGVSHNTISKIIDELEHDKIININTSDIKGIQKKYLVDLEKVMRLSNKADKTKHRIVRKRIKGQTVSDETNNETFDNIIGRFVKRLPTQSS